MHSTYNSRNLYRVEIITNRLRAYDYSIRCVDNLYKNYQNRIEKLVKKSLCLSNYIINYKVNIQKKNESYMINQFEGALMQEENRGMRDAGGMSNAEYKARSFALNFLIPLFDAASNKKPVETLPEAVAKILQLLPKPKP